MTDKPNTNPRQAAIEPTDDATSALPFFGSDEPAAINTEETALDTVSAADFAKMLKDAMASELDGLGTIQLPRIKIPSGGGIAFEIPSADPESPDISKTVTGTIILHHPINRLYLKGLDSKAAGEDDKAPDCYSNDGKTGEPVDMDAASAECYGGDCAACAMNQFGTARGGGKGKACSNRHRLLLLAEGQMFPWVVDVTPTSLKKFKEYVSTQLLTNHRPTWAMVTEIGLKKVQGAQADYAEMQFRTTKLLDPQNALAAKKKGESYRDAGV